MPGTFGPRSDRDDRGIQVLISFSYTFKPSHGSQLMSDQREVAREVVNKVDKRSQSFHHRRISSSLDRPSPEAKMRERKRGGCIVFSHDLRKIAGKGSWMSTETK